MVKRTYFSEINAARFTTSDTPRIQSSDQLKYTGFHSYSLLCNWLGLHGRFFQWEWKLDWNNCLFIYWLSYSKAGQQISSCPYIRLINYLPKQVNDQRITIKSKAPILVDDMLDLVQTLKKEDVLMIQKLRKKRIEVTYKYSCCSSRTAEPRSKGWQGRAELWGKIVKLIYLLDRFFELKYSKTAFRTGAWEYLLSSNWGHFAGSPCPCLS